MIMKANKQIGFIYKNNESIDKILKDGDVVFERGFLREKTSTTLPITFGGVGKNLKDYRVYGNTYQNSTKGKNICLQANIIDTNTIRFDINSNEINRTFTLSLIPPLSVNSMSIVTFADGVNLRSVGTINLISGERSTATITLTESIYNTIQNASEVHFNLYKSGAGISTTSIIEEPQIENNSSFTSYEPYTGGQPSPSPEFNQKIISCGDKTKNLFDKTSEIVENKYYTDTGEIANSTGDFISETYIPVQTGNYALSTSGSTTLRICTYDSSKTFIRREIATSSTLLNIAINSNEKYVRITGKLAEINSLQLEKGSTATSYEPYGYKIPVNVNNVITNIYLDEPLRKIDGYSDYIDFINGKVVRNIGETIFDGTESRWAYYTDTNKPVFYMGYVNTDWFYNKTDIWACYCNYYKGKNNVSSFDDVYNYGNNSIAFRTQYPRLVIRDDSKTSLNDFKTWLETHNLKVDYVLETPTEESITLPNIPTIEGNNTLNIETEITPSQVYIKYKSNE